MGAECKFIFIKAVNLFGEKSISDVDRRWTLFCLENKKWTRNGDEDRVNCTRTNLEFN